MNSLKLKLNKSKYKSLSINASSTFTGISSVLSGTSFSSSSVVSLNAMLIMIAKSVINSFLLHPKLKIHLDQKHKSECPAAAVDS